MFSVNIALDYKRRGTIYKKKTFYLEKNCQVINCITMKAKVFCYNYPNRSKRESGRNHQKYRHSLH